MLRLVLMNFLLTGCSGILERGADINDSLVDTAYHTTCYVGSIGAIRRKYFKTAEECQEWAAFCNVDITCED